MTHVLGYCRVSTEEQAASGAGLAAQRAAIRGEAERRGWQLVEVIEDAGFSGANLHRPGIATALEALKAHRADALVVAKLDRLSRSMLDFAGVRARSTKEGWALIALDVGVDTSTPAGEAMAHVLATFSQFERRLIGERTREALAAKRRAGVRLGRPRQVSQDVVDRIGRERHGGATLAAIADGLISDGVPTAQGGRRWHASTVRSVLKSAEHESLRKSAMGSRSRSSSLHRHRRTGCLTRTRASGEVVRASCSGLPDSAR
jgi:DNA invertase Pin-like site-specific DNA recombinase